MKYYIPIPVRFARADKINNLFNQGLTGRRLIEAVKEYNNGWRYHNLPQLAIVRKDELYDWCLDLVLRDDNDPEWFQEFKTYINDDVIDVDVKAVNDFLSKSPDKAFGYDYSRIVEVECYKDWR